MAPESALLSSALHAYHNPHLRARADALARFRACRLRVRAAQDRALFLSPDNLDNSGRALLVAEAAQSAWITEGDSSSGRSSGDLGSIVWPEGNLDEEEDPEPLKLPSDASNDITSLLVAPLLDLRLQPRFRLHSRKQTATKDAVSAAICVSSRPSAEQQRQAAERAAAWQSMMTTAAELKQQAAEAAAAAAARSKESAPPATLSLKLNGTLVRSWLIEFEVTAEVYTGKSSSSAGASTSTSSGSAEDQGNIVGYLVERSSPETAAATNAAKQQRRPSMASPMSGRSTGSSGLGTVCETGDGLDHDDADLAPLPQPPLPPQLQSAPERARALFPEALPLRPLPPAVPPPMPPPPTEEEEERLWVFRRRVARCVPINLRFAAARAATTPFSSRSSGSSGGSGDGVRVELEATKPVTSSSSAKESGSVSVHDSEKVSTLPPAALLASVQNATMPTFCAAAHDDPPLPFPNNDAKRSELLRKLNLDSSGVSKGGRHNDNGTSNSHGTSDDESSSIAAEAPAVIEPTLQSFAVPTEAAEAATAAAAAGVATGYPGLATEASAAALAAATAAATDASAGEYSPSTPGGNAGSYSNSADSSRSRSVDSVKQAAWTAVSAAEGNSSSTARGAVVWGGGLHLGACYTQWRPEAVPIPAHEEGASSPPRSPNSETLPDATSKVAEGAGGVTGFAGGGTRTMYLPSTLCLVTEDDPSLLPMHDDESTTSSTNGHAGSSSAAGRSSANAASDHHQNRPIVLRGSGAFSAALDLMRAALIDHTRLKATFFGDSANKSSSNNHDGAATSTTTAVASQLPSTSLVWRATGDHRSLDVQSLCRALRPQHVLACLQAACLDRTIVLTSRTTSALTLAVPALARLSNAALLGTPNEPSVNSSGSFDANVNNTPAAARRSSSGGSRRGKHRLLASSTVGGHVVHPLLPANHLPSLHKRRVAQPSQRYRPALVGLDSRLLALLKPSAAASPEPGTTSRSRASASRSSSGGGVGGVLAPGSSSSLEAAAVGASRDGLTSNNEDLLALQAAEGLRAPTQPPLTVEGATPGSPPSAAASTSSAAGGGGGRRRGSMIGLSSTSSTSPTSGAHQRPKHLRWVWALVPNDAGGVGGSDGREATSVATAIDDARDCAAAAVRVHALTFCSNTKRVLESSFFRFMTRRSPILFACLPLLLRPTRFQKLQVRGLRSLLHDAMVVDLDDDAIASPTTNTPAASGSTSAAAAAAAFSPASNAAAAAAGVGSAAVGIAGLPALPRRVREGFERSLHRAWHRKDLKAAAALLRPPPPPPASATAARGATSGRHGSNLWEVHEDDDSMLESDSEDSDESHSDEDNGDRGQGSSEAVPAAPNASADAPATRPDEAPRSSSTQAAAASDSAGVATAVAAAPAAAAALLSPRNAIFARLNAVKAAKKAAADAAAGTAATTKEAASGGGGSKAGASSAAGGEDANSGAFKLQKPKSDCRHRRDSKHTARVRFVAEESVAGAATLALARRVLLASALLPMRRFTRTYPNERVVALHRASLLQALTAASPAKQVADKACEAARTRQASHVPLPPPPPPRFGRQAVAVPLPPPRLLGGSGRADMSPSAAHAERAATEAVALHMAVLEADRAAAEADAAVRARWAFLRAMLMTASTEALLVSGDLIKLPWLPEA